MNIIKGCINTPKGFLAGGFHTGVKYKNKDLAIIYSKKECITSAVYTQNRVKASCVLRNKDITSKKESIKAVVINSGNANACNGEVGDSDNLDMAKTLADCLDIKEKEVLTASTGVIGVPLPIDKIKSGIKENYNNIGDSKELGNDACRSIMTTDTFTKEVCVTVDIDGKEITIAGMAKGSGMIHPNMATMLAFITTDVCISQDMLDTIFKDSIKDSYNMISVDGDTSTNDTAIIMANGCAQNAIIDKENDDFYIFKEAVDYVNKNLAKLIIKDGEGAGKFIEVNVNGASDVDSAKILSKSIITSNLVKTAFFGEDANWGRILCAMGYSGAEFDPNIIDIEYKTSTGNFYVMKYGKGIVFDEDYAKEVLSQAEIEVNIDLKSGEHKATAWGCDLSYEYVKINGDYRT